MMPNPRERPILEYVHSLENKVRKYQNESMRLNWATFCAGLMVGILVASAVWLVIRLTVKG